MSWISRLRNMLSKDHLNRDLDQKLRSQRTADNLADGMPLAEARYDAQVRFGNSTLHKEDTRGQNTSGWLEVAARDLRYALRLLKRSPSFTVVAVLTLGLGIGANTAIFSVVDAVLLRPLPYPEPDRLVHIWEASVTYEASRNLVNPINFLDWRDQAQSFESLAAISSAMTNLSSAGHPMAVQGMQVSPQFFSVLRIVPFLGRTFSPDDALVGQNRKVILSYELWQRQFGANREVIGQNVDVDGSPYAVVGIMPKGFSFPAIKAQVWTPLSLTRAEKKRGGRFLTVIARLKPGISTYQAQQEMLRVASFTAQARPDYNKNWSAQVVPMLEDVTQNVRRPLWVLLASVGFLLLIACANVGNLLLMRGTGRLREMAIRSALGAARSRLVQQLLIESLLLSLAGVVTGLLIAHIGLQALLALFPQTAPLPRNEPISIDGRVLLFTFSVSLFTAVLFGLVPALRLSLVDFQTALKQGTSRGGVGGHRLLRRSFVVAEVALALLLCTGAGLMLSSFYRLLSVNPGFSSEHLLTMHIWISPSRYADDLKRSQYVEHVLAEIRNTPGVQAAASTHFLPLTEKVSGSCFSPADQPPPTPGESPSAQFLVISSDYFRAMGTSFLSGRDFEDHDNFSSPSVAIVNQAFVERYFPRQKILGKQLHVCWTIQKPVEIIGIVADARQAHLRDVPEPTIFLANSQAPKYFATLVIRTIGEPQRIARSAEAAIHRVDPDQAVSDIQSMEDVFSDSVSSPRFQAILLLIFAGIAVALAMLGVYGVISYSVRQRTNEIGIRVALGARSAAIFRAVLGEALLLASIAMGLGLLGSLALNRVLETLLFEVRPTDPVILASVCCFILVVSALAAILPAWRATRIEPTVALRYE